MPDLAGLTPPTSEALARLKAGLAAQGFTMGDPISAFRTYQDQQQLYANYQAGRAGKPLPYPDRGPVALAARPGASPHEFGVAFDTGLHGAALDAANKLAPSLGLSTVGGDPGHFQLADWHGGSAAPAAPARINPGLTVNTSPLAGSHSQFIQDYARSIGLDPNLALGIANAEGLKAWSASNPNAASTVDVEGGKPFSFGDFQLNIHPGAMGASALAAGIDPRDPTQWQAADRFALDQMKAGGVGPWKGDPVAAAYLKSGAIPSAAAPGTTVNTAATAPAASGVLPGFGSKEASDNFIKSAKQLDQGLGFGGGEQQGQERPPQMGPPPAPRNVSQLLPISGQYSQAIQQNAATPLTWQGAAPGQNPYAAAGQQTAPLAPPYGLAINSMSPLMYDPSMGYAGYV